MPTSPTALQQQHIASLGLLVSAINLQRACGACSGAVPEQAFTNTASANPSGNLSSPCGCNQSKQVRDRMDTCMDSQFSAGHDYDVSGVFATRPREAPGAGEHSMCAGAGAAPDAAQCISRLALLT
jgi:hypothetical protein